MTASLTAMLVSKDCGLRRSRTGAATMITSAAAISTSTAHQKIMETGRCIGALARSSTAASMRTRLAMIARQDSRLGHRAGLQRRSSGAVNKSKRVATNAWEQIRVSRSNGELITRSTAVTITTWPATTAAAHLTPGTRTSRTGVAILLACAQPTQRRGQATTALRQIALMPLTRTTQNIATRLWALGMKRRRIFAVSTTSVDVRTCPSIVKLAKTTGCMAGHT